MIKVVNIKKEKYTLYIGRANSYYGEPDSKWANPYIIGKDGTRGGVIAKYKQYILNSPHLLSSLHEIDNQILGCYCSPDFACHGDILIALRNLQYKNRVIIAGGRTISNFNTTLQAIKNSKFHIDEIICGCAKGPDLHGKLYGEQNNIPVKKFPAKWNDFTIVPCCIKTRYDGAKYNSWAGHNRNKEMAQNASHLILVWNGKSSGSASMLKLAKDYKLIIYQEIIND